VTRSPGRGSLDVVLLIVVGLAHGRATAQQPAAEGPSFRSASTELVVLPVRVTDKRGQFVPDLPSKRFAVYDDGRQQNISFFGSGDQPVTVGLVIDTSGSMAAKLPHVEAAAFALARASNPDDQMFAIAFDDAVHEVQAEGPVRAADFAALQSALARLVPQGQTALYDALVAALDRLKTDASQRQVLVLVSDGGDNRSRATLADVLARARAANVSIYTIGLFDDAGLDNNPGVLKALAAATGGERYLPRSPGLLLQACVRIAGEIRHSYTLAYAPPHRDGAYHEVRVTIEPTGRERLTVRTRPGYIAATSEH
jgi:Ca-activated chloride channel family protein